ncbi:MAG TPA: glycosyltransferase family 10 [Alphaproteobacteria bacterium]|nr:glycosyltransferase family 10 [Alphaproteobacteria bacterium]
MENSLEFYKPYKFVIAFENKLCRGYTTEKIAHARHSLCCID